MFGSTIFKNKHIQNHHNHYLQSPTKEKVLECDIEEFDPENISKKATFALNQNILAFRKERYINPQRQFAGITSKGLQFRVQGKDITQNNAYIVKNPLNITVSNESQKNTKKLKI